MTLAARLLAIPTGFLLRFRAWRSRPVPPRGHEVWLAHGGTVERAGWLGLSRRYRHPWVADRFNR